MNKQNGFTIKHCDHFTIHVAGESVPQISVEDCRIYEKAREQYKNEHPTLLLVDSKTHNVYFLRGDATREYLLKLPKFHNSLEITGEYEAARRKLGLKNGSVAYVYESSLTYSAHVCLEKNSLMNFMFEAYESFKRGANSLDEYMERAKFVNDVMNALLFIYRSA